MSSENTDMSSENTDMTSDDQEAAANYESAENLDHLRFEYDGFNSPQ